MFHCTKLKMLYKMNVQTSTTTITPINDCDNEKEKTCCLFSRKLWVIYLIISLIFGLNSYCYC